MTLLKRLLAWRPLPWGLAASLVVLVMAWTFTATPRYRSSALLQLTPQTPAAPMADALSSLPGAGLLGLGRDGLETEMGLLQSRRVLDAVIDSLVLTVRREEPAIGRDSLVALARIEGAEVEGLLVLRREEGGRFALDAGELRPALTLPQGIAVGERLEIGNVALTLRESLRGDDAPARITLRFVPRFVARRTLESRLDLMRPSTGAQLIRVSLDDPDPRIAARALERLVAEYLQYSSGAAGSDARSTVEGLRVALDSTRRALAAADAQLRSFQERTGLVVPEEQAAMQVQRYAALRTQYDVLEVERRTLVELLALVAERAEDRGPSAYRQLATFPNLISNGAIQDLLTTLTELENDRSALRLLRSEQNADVRQLSGRIAEIEEQLRRVGAEYLEGVTRQAAAVETALAEIDRELGVLPERQVALLKLLREQKIASEAYVAIERQLRATELMEAVRRDAVRVVDAPVAADVKDPQFPKPAVHLVLALVLAAAAAAAVVALRGALVATAD